MRPDNFAHGLSGLILVPGFVTLVVLVVFGVFFAASLVADRRSRKRAAADPRLHEDPGSPPPADADLARELDIRASIARPYPTGALVKALARRRASRSLAQQIAEERPREMAVGDFE